MVTVRFGNLSAKQFDIKVGSVLSEEDKTWLEDKRIHNASFDADDKLHIFEKPLGIVAGNNIVKEVISRLRRYDYDTEFYVESRT